MAQTVKHQSTTQETCVQSLGWEDLPEKEQPPTPVFFPGKSHGWRSLIGCSLRACEESDTTEQCHFNFLDFPGGSDSKSVCLQCERPGFNPWVGKIPWKLNMANFLYNEHISRTRKYIMNQGNFCLCFYCRIYFVPSRLSDIFFEILFYFSFSYATSNLFIF